MTVPASTVVASAATKALATVANVASIRLERAMVSVERKIGSLLSADVLMFRFLVSWVGGMCAVLANHGSQIPRDGLEPQKNNTPINARITCRRRQVKVRSVSLVLI